MIERIEYAPFEWQRHLRGILALCVSEGWRGLTEPASLRQALSAPGVFTLVAVRYEEVIGFVQRCRATVCCRLTYL